MIRCDPPSAANPEFADALGRALKGEPNRPAKSDSSRPKQLPKTEGDRQRAKRRAVKLTRRKRFRY